MSDQSTTERIAELKRLAEKATPGPWRATQYHVIAQETEDRLGFDLNTKSANGNRDDARHLAAYIAAVSPQAILSLIERIAELEKLNAELVKALRDVVAIADRETDPFIRARAIIASAASHQKEDKA
jgi:hypothetical protein